jgi:hypothetical protein
LCPLILIVEERDDHLSNRGVTVFFEWAIQTPAEREPWIRIRVSEDKIFDRANEALLHLITLSQPAQLVDAPGITQRISADVTTQASVTRRLVLSFHSSTLGERLSKIIV